MSESSIDLITAPERRSVVIVTALDLETRAVLRHLESWTDDQVEQGTVFYTGKFEEWDVAVVETGPGNIAAATLASRAFGRFRPEVALFVGVGGGVKDVSLGDVVVGTKIYGYESGKDTADGFLPRPDLDRSAHGLGQRARAVAKSDAWLKRLDPALIRDDAPALFVGPIAAGEKVVVSKRSATAKFLKKEYGDTLAVEMEGRGFLEAVHISSVLGTVVRGISDRLSGKAVADKAGWQPKAADAASAVAFEMLSRLNKSPSSPPPRNVVGGGVRTAQSPSTAETEQEKQPLIRHLAVEPTLNDGSFFKQGEILARVGVKNVDEVEFTFRELPDSFIRIIPCAALPAPIALSHLNSVAGYAPLLKLKQYGAFNDVNRLGAVAYDPGGAHRGGTAPLFWATQLFPNGELWLASNTMIVRERGERPAWVPIPFIPALNLESVFFEKAHASIAFAMQHLGLTFPCLIEMGIMGTEDVTLAVVQEDMRTIHQEQIVLRQTLSGEDNVNDALLAFFEQVYDATGYRRPDGLFGFPPNRPKA
ncbi:5'-methylthioadenosine/S-adenosylhomocysteine nucleosidase family protein [Tardiphaga sp. 367_B4_N1_1]|uniref:5'-methylthioadenosine/S-adenosylhomocysteine nucleosidase family protein n=1 Tax=Tardiphaga sp. 367_B4_N1_1 TaxID=3240777 RepID=UPI003F297324